MNEMTINHAAVFVCAVLNLALGALWYSPAIFFRAWQHETGITDEQLKNVKPAKLYSVTFLLALFISYNLAFFLGDGTTDWTWGLTAGFLAGFGWASLIFAIVALFEQRSWRYIAINGGYITLYFTIIGFILGIWK